MSIAFSDSWSGHKDEQLLLEASGGKDVYLKIIPLKTTKYAQHLDVLITSFYQRLPDAITIQK